MNYNSLSNKVLYRNSKMTINGEPIAWTPEQHLRFWSIINVYDGLDLVKLQELFPDRPWIALESSHYHFHKIKTILLLLEKLPTAKSATN
jgi:hypothetical protein